MNGETIGIVNYKNAGNIKSVHKAVLEITNNVRLINSATDFKSVSKIILPGVGTFNKAMASLGSLGFVEELKQTNKPILGICVGMHILARLGYENGITDGLDLIDGEVQSIVSSHKVPHVGFNAINVVGGSTLLKGLNGKKFYFMHSYEFINYKNISALSNYMGHEFVSAIECKNVFGVQFHPEKSRQEGLMLLDNFSKIKVN